MKFINKKDELIVVRINGEQTEFLKEIMKKTILHTYLPNGEIMIWQMQVENLKDEK